MAAAKDKAAEVEAAEVVKAERPVDVVALPSLRADGTPDQTPGFVQLVESDPRVEDAAPDA